MKHFIWPTANQRADSPLLESVCMELTRIQADNQRLRRQLESSKRALQELQADRNGLGLEIDRALRGELLPGSRMANRLQLIVAVVKERDALLASHKGKSGSQRAARLAHLQAQALEDEAQRWCCDGDEAARYALRLYATATRLREEAPL